MRLSLALPALAGGLLLGWASIAAADAAPPPAAPIFYCPSAAQKPAGAPAAQAPACPVVQHAAAPEHRHWRHRREVRVAERRAAPPSQDVSASQAFIYRYEEAQHGLNARAADQAWAHAGPPPCPDQRGCPPHRQWAAAPPPPQVIVERAPPQPPQVIIERAPPPPPQVIIERAAPPPPQIIIEHPPAPPPQVVFERAPAPPPQVIYERAPACPDRCPPPRAAYGWQDRSEGAGYAIERQESVREGGWRYSEQNGRAHYQAWGDAPRHRPCPPSVPENRCAGAAGYAAGAYASGERQWRDGSYGQVYEYSGRDASGYLVWPGKAP
jgi:hypothetical protein